MTRGRMYSAGWPASSWSEIVRLNQVTCGAVGVLPADAKVKLEVEVGRKVRGARTVLLRYE